MAWRMSQDTTQPGELAQRTCPRPEQAEDPGKNRLIVFKPSYSWESFSLSREL